MGGWRTQPSTTQVTFIPKTVTWAGRPGEGWKAEGGRKKAGLSCSLGLPTIPLWGRSDLPEHFQAAVAVYVYCSQWRWTVWRHISGCGKLYWRGQLKALPSCRRDWPVAWRGSVSQA